METPQERIDRLEAQVIEMTKAGFAAWKIAEETGYSLVTVRGIVTRARRQEALPGDQTHDTRRGSEAFPHAEIIALRKQGKSVTDICAVSGYSPSHVIVILRTATAQGEVFPRKSRAAAAWKRIPKEQAEEAIRTSPTLLAASEKLGISQMQLGYLRAYHHIERQTLRQLRAERPTREMLRRKGTLVLHDAGWSFESIGTILGISRQGAEQLWSGAREDERLREQGEPKADDHTNG